MNTKLERAIEDLALALADMASADRTLEITLGAEAFADVLTRMPDGGTPDMTVVSFLTQSGIVTVRKRRL